MRFVVQTRKYRLALRLIAQCYALACCRHLDGCLQQFGIDRRRLFNSPAKPPAMPERIEAVLRLRDQGNRQRSPSSFFGMRRSRKSQDHNNLHSVAEVIEYLTGKSSTCRLRRTWSVKHPILSAISSGQRVFRFGIGRNEEMTTLIPRTRSCRTSSWFN